MTTVVIALISFAIAFVAGVILSKAYFAVRGTGDSAAMNEQRHRYRKRVDALQTVIQRHEDAQEQIKKRLRNYQSARDKNSQGATKTSVEIGELRRTTESLRDQVKSRDRDIEALRERTESAKTQVDASKHQAEAAQNEVSLLRIECDELLARIQRLESEQRTEFAASPTEEQDQDQARVTAALRAEMGEMRESLATRNRQVHDLELQVKERVAETQTLLGRLDSLKQRVSPLTSKLKQQRNLIREFRELEAASVDAGSGNGNHSVPPADNLKKIHGIGPALERRLHRHGIRRFEQLAELSEQDLAKIAEQLAIAPQLAQRDRWIEQARDLIGDRTAVTA